MAPDETWQNPCGPLMQFPKDISTVRAYVFSCLSGEKNSDFMNESQYMAGATRFSLDNPVPAVSSRCALYGNQRDIMVMLHDGEKEYGKHAIKVDSKLFTAYTMGLPEMKNFARRKTQFHGKRSVEQSPASVEHDETDEQEEAAKRRKPLSNAYETPKAKFDDANRI